MAVTPFPYPRSSARWRPSLLRLHSDERLVELVRQGQQPAFDVLVARYQARLLSFCQHLLRSREDAEDILQDVFAAAFTAMRADNRPINVRPWLYRIARNRSLNHLRRAKAVGMDSLDHHQADQGQSSADIAHRREQFETLLGDIKELPETQRSALLMREMGALSYEQIAESMGKTVSSVKSLLVRARCNLAEAAEARVLSCQVAQDELREIAAGERVLAAPVTRRHLRTCELCAELEQPEADSNGHGAWSAFLPVALVGWLKRGRLGRFGSSTGAGAGAAGAGSAAPALMGGGAAGGLLSGGAAAMAGKAAAGIAAAVLGAAGAVLVDNGASRPHSHPAAVDASAAHSNGPAYLGRPSGTSSARTTPKQASRSKPAKLDPGTGTSTEPTTTTTPLMASTPPTVTTPTTATAPGRVDTQTDATALPGSGASTETSAAGDTTSPGPAPTTGQSWTSSGNQSSSPSGGASLTPTTGTIP